MHSSHQHAISMRGEAKKFFQCVHNLIDVKLWIFSHGFNYGKKIKKQYYKNTKNGIVHKLNLLTVSFHTLYHCTIIQLSIFKNVSHSKNWISMVGYIAFLSYKKLQYLIVT